MATPPSLGQDITPCQDIVRCQLCTNPVEHHCNFCHVDLCSSCIQSHMADKTKRHEVVEFINRKKGPVLPECNSHDKTLCEMYCNDCHEPTCVLCVTTTHKKHDITDIKSILENFKQRIIADVEELESTICPNYMNADGGGVTSVEFDKIMNAIQDHEDAICNVVREIGSQLKAEIAKEKREYEHKNEEMQSSVAKTGKELNLVIQKNKSILESNDATNILNYQSKNEQFRGGPKQMQINLPMFLSGKIRWNELQKMFGSLSSRRNFPLDGKRGRKSLLTNPVVLSTIQTPYGKNQELWRVLCDKSENIWISGRGCKIYQIDQEGSVLKTINAFDSPRALSLNVKKELRFCVRLDSKVYKYDGNEVRTMVDLSPWYPRGLCHSANGKLLVSMRSADKTESRVVRYSETAETTVIQSDSRGTPLFSVGVNSLLSLTENGNGDICVADYSGKAVVVVNASGKLRFKYEGKTTFNKLSCEFCPAIIATDVNQQILINDFGNDIAHVIDSDGNFLRYIKYSCKGGLSINSDHNLVIGELITGKIRIIKYLE